MCLRPITKKMPDGNIYTFSCGKCVECVLRYQDCWKQRLSYEYKCWKYTYFLTLTYRDENIPYVNFDCDDDMFLCVKAGLQRLPKTKSWFYHRRHRSSFSDYMFPDRLDYGTVIPFVSRVDVQLYLKRLREHYYRDRKERLDFKYFICSEYGPCTLRPHYHAIFFTNMNLFDFQMYFVNNWKYGNVEWEKRCIDFDANGDISAPMAYVAKYCCKPEEFENPYVSVGYLPRPFRLISKGIGKNKRDELFRIISDCTNPKKSLFHGQIYDKESDYFGYSKTFVSWVDQQLTTFSLTNKGKVISSQMPRYWRNAVLPQEKRVYSFWNKKTQQFESKIRYEKSRTNTLCLALDKFVEDKYFDKLRRYDEQAKAENPRSTSVEIIHRAESLRLEDDKLRHQKAYKVLRDYYTKNARKFSY